jgi:rubrerythrin
MIYACDDCDFLFYRMSPIKECPSCKKERIRPATKKEIERLRLYLEGQRVSLSTKQEQNS